MHLAKQLAFFNQVELLYSFQNQYHFKENLPKHYCCTESLKMDLETKQQTYSLSPNPQE